jgi:alanine-synthesizing transaminase
MPDAATSDGAGDAGSAGDGTAVFSPRLSSDLKPNRLTGAIRQRRSEGLPIIDLTESNPTRAGFEYPQDLLSPLANPRGLLYAPQPLGLLPARRAIAAEYLRRGLAVDPERVVLTASTSEAYSFLFKLLA